MNKLITWLKSAMGKSGPPSPVPSPQGEGAGAVERLRAENLALRAMLRRPFEARETESAPPWANEDANNWRKFLATATGERLARLVNYWTQVEAQRAALRLDKHEYACGLAAGWHNEGDFILHRLSADLPPQTEGDTLAGAGAADVRERVAP